MTDANLLPDLRDPANFAGGADPPHPYASEKAVACRLTDTTGLIFQQAAFGVTEMVDENMTNAARVHTVWNGHDIEHVIMIGFGRMPRFMPAACAKDLASRNC